MTTDEKQTGVRLKELRNAIEAECSLSGNSLSNEIKILLKESLRQRYQHRSLSQIISAWSIEYLAKESGISEERLGQIACEMSPPTCGELVRFSGVLPMSAAELLEISTLKPTVRSEETDEKETQSNEKQIKTTKKRKSNAKEKEYVCAN